jgi:hypothetical protein
MYDPTALFELNRDVLHVHGEARLWLLCRCLANNKNLGCSYSPAIVAAMRGLRLREDPARLSDAMAGCRVSIA